MMITFTHQTNQIDIINNQVYIDEWPCFSLSQQNYNFEKAISYKYLYIFLDGERDVYCYFSNNSDCLDGFKKHCYKLLHTICLDDFEEIKFIRNCLNILE